jgi:hypothetical protein
LTSNDSDSDSDSESGNSQCGESISSSSSSSDDEDSNNVPLGDTWDQGCDFKPTEPNPSKRFADHCTSTAAQNRRQRIGLQCSLIYVNTPIGARREVFKTTLLDKIVRYTNKYGLLHAKRCVGMTGTWFIACQMTAISLSLMSAAAEV